MSAPAPSRVLPASPNLEQQKKLARELLRALKAGDPSALDRARARHPRLAERRAGFALSDAQLVLAREYGFASWPALKSCIDGLARPGATQPFVADPSWYDGRAKGLVEMHRGRLPTALAQIRAWHPNFGSTSDEAIAAAAFDQNDARLVYARQNGASTWDELMTRVAAMAKPAAEVAGASPEAKRRDQHDADRRDGRDAFARAFAALERRDSVAFRAAIDRTPRIVRERGTNGNSLLNLAVAIAGEDGGFVEMLLAAGADPNVPNDRGWTPLHQAAMKDLPALVDRLIAAGAVVTISAHGDGGTPLAAALIWSHRASAARLASIAIVPDNLRIHAALNRVDALPRLFRTDGTLTPEAKAGRGFYRVHSGFPAWMPSDRDQEVLDDALTWAARNDAVDAMAFLVVRGADVNGIAYRGTPLMHAAYHRHIAAVRWLLEHGADPNLRATFHGMETGRCTALHLAAQTDDEAVVSLLLRHGADRTIRDENYNGDAAGWAEYAKAWRTHALLA